MLCYNKLSFINGFTVEGELQITTDAKQVFCISINETIGLRNDDLSFFKQDLDIIEQHTSRTADNIIEGNVVSRA